MDAIQAKSEAYLNNLYGPGQSGNPAGRPKGFKGLAKDLRKRISEMGGDETQPNKVFIDFAINVWQGKEAGVTTFAERWKAFEWLADRAFGKAPILIDNLGDAQAMSTTLDLTGATDEELEAMDNADRAVENINKRAQERNSLSIIDV